MTLKRTARRTATTGLRAGAAGLLLLGAAACGSSGSKAATDTTKASGSSGGSATDAVSVKDFKFNPDNITVKVGAKVTWTYNDNSPHNTQFEDKSIPLIGTDAGLTGGKTADHTFDKAGTFKYFCGIHNYMTGSVTVEA